MTGRPVQVIGDAWGADGKRFEVWMVEARRCWNKGSLRKVLAIYFG
jgi:hypothetical protein